jgi:hypothetical protein
MELQRRPFRRYFCACYSSLRCGHMGARISNRIMCFQGQHGWFQAWELRCIIPIWPETAGLLSRHPCRVQALGSGNPSCDICSRTFFSSRSCRPDARLHMPLACYPNYVPSLYELFSTFPLSPVIMICCSRRLEKHEILALVCCRRRRWRGEGVSVS